MSHKLVIRGRTIIDGTGADQWRTMIKLKLAFKPGGVD